MDTGPSSWWAPKEVARTYNESLAKLIGGAVNETGKKPDFGLRTGRGGMPRLSDLLPRLEQHWLDAMELYIRDSLADSSAG